MTGNDPDPHQADLPAADIGDECDTGPHRGATILERVNDEEILEAIAARVDNRDYLDEVFVRPGRLTGSGDWLLSPGTGDSVWQAEIRGSKEHLAALAAGAVNPLPELSPAGAEAVAEAEHDGAVWRGATEAEHAQWSVAVNESSG